MKTLDNTWVKQSKIYVLKQSIIYALFLLSTNIAFCLVGTGIHIYRYI